MQIRDLKSIQQKIEQRKGQRSKLQEQKDFLQQQNKELGKEARKHEQALAIVKQVGLNTQQQLQYHISDIGSMALDSIFPDPYSLKVEFVERREKTECDLFFEREGSCVDPLSASGGGAVDVAAFALRVASWAMEQPRSRNTLLLDEPFRYLSENMLPDAGKMVQQLSQELGLQIILITHSEALIDSADKIFSVIQKNGKSEII